MEEKEYQSIIDQKCPRCYKKSWCMCLPSQRALFCLGPFKDEEDNEKKKREDKEKEKKKANLKGYVSDDLRDLYRANQDLLKHGSGSDRDDSEEEDK